MNDSHPGSGRRGRVGIHRDRFGFRYVSVDLSSNVALIKQKLQPALDKHGERLTSESIVWAWHKAMMSSTSSVFLGNVDILVNCAGSAIARYFEETTEEMYHQMMNVNFYSAVNLTKVGYPTCIRLLMRLFG